MDKVKEVLKKYTEPQGLWRIFCMMTAIFLMGVSLSFSDFSGYGNRPIFFYEPRICSCPSHVIWNMAASYECYFVSDYVSFREKSHWLGNTGKYDGNWLCS